MKTFLIGCGLLAVSVALSWGMVGETGQLRFEREALAKEADVLREVVLRSKVVLADSGALTESGGEVGDSGLKNAEGIEVLRVAENAGGMESRLRGPVERVLDEGSKNAVSISVSARGSGEVIEAVIVERKAEETTQVAPKTIAQQLEYLAAAERVLADKGRGAKLSSSRPEAVLVLGNPPEAEADAMAEALPGEPDTSGIMSLPDPVASAESLWAEESIADGSPLPTYTYLGVVKKGRGEPAGVFRDEAGRRVVTAKPGEMLGEWRVAAVSSDSAVLEGLGGVKRVVRR